MRDKYSNKVNWPCRKYGWVCGNLHDPVEESKMSTSVEMQQELDALDAKADELAEAIRVKQNEEEEAANREEEAAEAKLQAAIDATGQEGPGERVNVTVLINGQDVGSVEGNRVLGAVIQEFGARHGLRTVVAFSGDARLTADQATSTLQDLGVSTLDVRTKDQRA